MFAFVFGQCEWRARSRKRRECFALAASVSPGEALAALTRPGSPLRKLMELVPCNHSAEWIVTGF